MPEPGRTKGQTPRPCRDSKNLGHLPDGRRRPARIDNAGPAAEQFQLVATIQSVEERHILPATVVLKLVAAQVWRRSTIRNPRERPLRELDQRREDLGRRQFGLAPELVNLDLFKNYAVAMLQQH